MQSPTYYKHLMKDLERRIEEKREEKKQKEKDIEELEELLSHAEKIQKKQNAVLKITLPTIFYPKMLLKQITGMLTAQSKEKGMSGIKETIRKIEDQIKEDDESIKTIKKEIEDLKDQLVTAKRNYFQAIAQEQAEIQSRVVQSVATE